MWLLSSDRAELKFFNSPEDVKEGYVALSHVWGDGEQNHQVVREIAKRCEGTTQNPRDLMSEKIRRCCELAESHGYKWVWIDTCCIDKTSSAELSEAINSMYRFYALSEVCYTFLHDVPEDALSTRDSIFRGCKWITRGWTLQELLASKVVVFLDQSWRMLGTKGDFAEDLEACTKIPMSVLRYGARLDHFSIAERMSWAAGRVTTRIEDRAYSLLGIFDINMSTLYGEGKKAFYRLQEEIMKRSPDTTLFAWGQIVDFSSLQTPSGQSDLLSLMMPSIKLPTAGGLALPLEMNLLPSMPDLDVFIRAGLFADSPQNFASCDGICHSPPPAAATPVTKNGNLPYAAGGQPGRILARVPTFNVTPHGILSEIPVVTARGRMFGDLFWKAKYGHQPEVRFLLSLIVEKTSDPSRPLYHTGIQGAALAGGGQNVRRRIVRVTQDEYDDIMREASGQGQSLWRTIYLASDSGYTKGDRMGQLPSSNNSLFSLVRVAPAALNKLLDDVPGLSLSGLDDSHTFAPWGKPDAPVVLSFSSNGLWFKIFLGQCPASSQRGGQAIWASLRQSEEMFDINEPDKREHSCAHDHISEWHDMKKTFELDASRLKCWRSEEIQTRLSVTLSFSPCAMSLVSRTFELAFETSVDKIKKTVDHRGSAMARGHSPKPAWEEPEEPTWEDPEEPTWEIPVENVRRSVRSQDLMPPVQPYPRFQTRSPPRLEPRSYRSDLEYDSRGYRPQSRPSSRQQGRYGTYNPAFERSW